MSSGIKMDGDAARSAMMGAASSYMGAYTPRQVMLNRQWSFFRCEHYNNRSVMWDGSPAGPDELISQIGTQGYVTPGFVNINEQTQPLRFRRPTAPYHIGRVIVERFTGLLFSQRRHPKITVPGDDTTEDFLEAVVEAGSFWARMVQARNFGGAMGSVALGFKIVQGKPVFEVFDPRWCLPDFLDPIDQELDSFVFQIPYTETTYGKKDEPIYNHYFYRREVNQLSDRVWKRLPQDADPESYPPSRTVEHGLGFCPVVWIQNQEVQGEVDGDSDLHGTYDMIEAMDALTAQANKGVLLNCDPTLVITSDDDIDALMKGSGNAIKLAQGNSASYLEINGMGPKSALELADRFEQKICRMARMVLDQSSAVTKTATEIDRDYSSMLEKADVLREQYGERGIKKILSIVLRVCRNVLQPRLGPTGQIEIPQLALPPRAVTDPKTGAVSYVNRQLGPSSTIQLQWGPYFQPTLDDANKAVQAASMAKEKGLASPESATKFVASYFGIEDVPAELHKITTAQEEELKKLQEMANQQMQQEEGGGEEAEPTEDEAEEELPEEADQELEDEFGGEEESEA